MENTLTQTTPTFDFIWKNGVLMQKVYVHISTTGENVRWEEVTAPPQVDWKPVLVGGKQIKDPTFQTFEQRNGREPQVKRDGYDHVIEFDGGTDCNDPKKGFGNGYGSYKIDGQDVKRVKFGKGHSNNSAELRTLVEALKELAGMGGRGKVLCRGDSQIALKWIDCPKMPKKGSEGFLGAILLLREEVAKFASVRGEWRRRTHSLALFGH